MGHFTMLPRWFVLKPINPCYNIQHSGDWEVNTLYHRKKPDNLVLNIITMTSKIILGKQFCRIELEIRKAALRARVARLRKEKGESATDSLPQRTPSHGLSLPHVKKNGSNISR